MAFVHGKQIGAWLSSISLADYLTSLDVGVTADQADTTVFTSTWKTSVTGTIGAQVGFAGYYDVNRTELGNTLNYGAPWVLTFGPSGLGTIGNPARLFSVTETTYAMSVPVGGMVAISGSLTVGAAVGIGNVLHPMGFDTDTTTGSTRTDAAATSTGWTAAIHVIDVSAGSWVVKLEDSANGSDWADVSLGAFTALTNPGYTSQLLRSAAGDTTLRKYVRYVATRTGGAGTDYVGFLLSYARNT